MIEDYFSFCQKYPIISSSVFITFIPIALSFYRKSYISKAFSFLLIYLVTKLVIDLLMFHFASQRQSSVIFYNLSIPAYYCLLSGMYYVMFDTSRYKIFVLWSIPIFTIFSVWDIVHVNKDLTNLHDYRIPLYAGTIQSLLMILWILLYLYETIKLLKIPNLFKFPFFWVCSGFLLYFSSQVFIASVLHYTEQWINPLDLGFVYNVPYIFEIVCAILISIAIWIFSPADYAKQ